ncbi:exonuclease domain-containing protein [Caldimonas brevitalea]|uniref:DNA-directed DNA polymerase n=1 Tax=Caldimonas brevitalea TaxID=413882 RepID=A0A0G3BP18_9BURK|nr:exonuclease domain-containing protein [Caldimonas brevitalea]AKJ31204.1 DNA polymerase III subunit epsilon [Caldimonas brevitalea]
MSPSELQRCLSVHPRLAFVDLETTGGSAGSDTITEVAIIEVDAAGVREWSSLVCPGRPIPPFIQSLTGITDAMVADAPRFESLAPEIVRRLEGRLFIAHNAGFDHGFLRHHLQAIGVAFAPQVLCTVKLSRRLYPEQERHNLDALVARHRLQVTHRHRALGDAQLIWQFWQAASRELSADVFTGALRRQLGGAARPAQLELPGLHDLPEGPGVYLFYGEHDEALYVGRASRLRQRVLSHLRSGQAQGKPLSQQVRRVEWRATSGPLGSALQELALRQVLQPRHNAPAAPAQPLPQAAVPAWPYPGAIGVREADALHLLDRWSYLGTARDGDDIAALLHRPARFDAETCQLLLAQLNRLPARRVTLLDAQLDLWSSACA